MNVAPVHIRTAGQLRDALTAGEPALRYAALDAVRRDPRAAQAYGAAGGRDVIAILLDLEAAALTSLDRRLVLAALTAFDGDDRVTAACQAVFARKAELDLLRIAVFGLARLPADRAYRFFAPWLKQDGWEDHARLAAGALADSPLLTPRERIRRAAVDPEHARDVPAVSADTLDHWLLELNGAFAAGAQALLRTQGRAALLVLLPHWDRLHPGPARWLLEWGVTDAPREAVPQLARALRQRDEAMAVAALRLVPRLGGAADAAALRQAAARFAMHKDPDVRLAAARAGVTREPWELAAVQALDPRLRVVAAQWLARDGGPRAAATLVTLLADEHWSVRAAAADLLKRSGPEVVPLVQPLVRHERLEVRAAAVQVLLAQHQYDWLEAQLPACSPI